MDAGALSGGQVIDAPPTHLQEYKRNEQYPQSELWLVSGYLPVMHLDKIGEVMAAHSRTAAIAKYINCSQVIIIINYPLSIVNFVFLPKAKRHTAPASII